MHRDMAKRMAGNIDHIADSSANGEVVALAKGYVESREAVCIGGGSGDAGGVMGAEVGQAIDMVPMVMGQEHQIGAPAPAGQRLKKRRGFGDINDASEARGGVMGEIGVVVLQAGDGHDLKGHGFLVLSHLSFTQE